MSEAHKILVIDDQLGLRGSRSHDSFVDKYSGLGYEFVFSTAEEGTGNYTVGGAMAAIELHSDAALVILDIKFGSESDRLGIDILNELELRYPLIPVVMMSSLDTEPAAVVKCMRLGARDYISKSPTPDDLSKVIENNARRVTESHPILGNSRKIKELRSLIERVAQNASVSVLIAGERGTGKELVARNIHYLGRRRSAPFIAVNCAAFPHELLAVELFGAERGAYTGAHKTKYGYIELANGGVLFLDEIGEMPLDVQANLLRVLETRAFRRVGVSTSEINVDFQLICATNADLKSMVQQGKFRADLYDRVKALEIRTPPLRECLEDIELLAAHALREIREAPGGTSYHVQDFDRDVIERFKSYGWPGNVREFRNAIESAMIRATSATIRAKDLPSEISDRATPTDGFEVPNEGLDLNLKLAEIELRYLMSAYKSAGENKARTMQLFYPGTPANYFDRMIYEAVQRAPSVLLKFPGFQSFYEKEKARRENR